MHGLYCPLLFTPPCAMRVLAAAHHLSAAFAAFLLQVKEIALEGTWKVEESHRKAHHHDAAADAAAAAEAASSAADAAAMETPAGKSRWLHWT